MTEQTKDVKGWKIEQPEWMPDSLTRAFEFARDAHRKQARKYTGEPYIVHPVDVCHRLWVAIENLLPVVGAGASQLVSDWSPALKAALLHDTVEDCGVTFQKIEMEFGPRVAELVYWLTDTITPEQGNRAMRKKLEALRLSRAPVMAQIVKLCDLASNTESIVAHDPDFAVTYLKEKAHVLHMLSWSDSKIDQGWRTESIFITVMQQASRNICVNI